MSKLLKIKSIFEGEGGIKHLLNVALPLILSTSTFTIMQFVDRKFLYLHSVDSFKAAAPAGMLNFTFLSLFFGAANYLNAYVARFTGERKRKEVGMAIWQGIYFSIIAYICLLPLLFFSKDLFVMFGHEAAIIKEEVQYFDILLITSLLVLLNTVLSTFYSGRAKTRVILGIRIFALLLNIPLDYILIFGKFGFPELGIVGAGIATGISTLSATICFALLVFSKKNREEYGTLSRWRFNKPFFMRFIKLGIPSGSQLTIDIFGYTFVLMMIGKIGGDQMSATNIAWTLYVLALVPMVGLSISIQTLFGIALGRNDIALAEKSVRSSLFVITSYMAIITFIFVFIPEIPIQFFTSGKSLVVNVQELEYTKHFLYFISSFLLFNGLNFVYAACIKGAGDTNFVMKLSLGCSTFLLVIPAIYFNIFNSFSAHYSWGALSLYMITVGIVVSFRYKKRLWIKNSSI